MSKKASIKKSSGLFLLSLTLVMAFRWIGYEPFVIPSGSMIPTLLINDHILVSKHSFGLRIPFTSRWLIPPSAPARGEVVVFRSVEKDDFYMIKRVIGLPGDVIEFTEAGILKVNGVPVESAPIDGDALKELISSNKWTEQDLGAASTHFEFKNELLGQHEHTIMLEKEAFRYAESGRVVPEGKLFLMGDNRDRSRDSRVWGVLPLENLLGKALFVWLSCSKTLLQTNFVCDPRHIRWQRLFHSIE